MPISDADFRDLTKRVGILEGYAPVYTERYTETMKRFDKQDEANDEILKKLTALQTRNDFQDGGSSVRGGIIKGLIAIGTAGFSGGLFVELVHWFTGRAHP